MRSWPTLFAGIIATIAAVIGLAGFIRWLRDRNQKKRHMPFSFGNNDKFSFVAVHGCYSYVEEETQLSDGTWILPKLPTGIDDTWASWIGSIQLERLTGANLILLRRVTSATPENLDNEHGDLLQEVLTLFWLLQLSGVVQYGGASAIQGSFHRGEVNIRQMIQLDDYYPTEGSPSYPVTSERLEEAAKSSAVWRELKSQGTHDRFRRGARILRDALETRNGQDRLRELTRSIEALIKPDKKKTTTYYFKVRGQTLGVKSHKSEEILFDSYQMRCDTEHVHPWDRHLRKYPANEREAVANLRVRQMEALARESYRRIFINSDVRSHFASDDALEKFWNLGPDEQRKIWGPGIDVTAFKDDDAFEEKKRQILERHANG